MKRGRPIIGVVSDRRMLGPHPFQVQGEKYLRAVSDGAGGLPVGIPSFDPPIDLTELLATLDGILLTGSPSNVEPHHYAGYPSREGTLHDPARDAATLPLIPAVIAAGMPLLAVCRGFQELNVAHGGTLHQELQHVPGLIEHREDKSAPLEQQYAPTHDVDFTPGGLLEKITGRRSTKVNTLHTQGIDKLGDQLLPEARAPDGLIEAVTRKQAPGFLLGVQWHPEWRVTENEVSMAIFRAFGDACRRYRS